MLPSFAKHEKKREEALKRVQKLSSKYPELAEVNKEIEKLTRDLNNFDIKELQSLIKKKENLFKKYKIPQNIEKPKYDCPYCEDTGYIELIDQEASKEYNYKIVRLEKCGCLIDAEKQHRLNRLFKTAQLTKTMHRQTFDNFKLEYYSNIAMKNGYTYRQIMKYNRDIAKEFADDIIGNNNEQKGLFLQGKPGVGKTFLCSAIANKLIKNQVPVLYLPFVDFLYQLRDTFGSSDEKMDELIGAAKTVDVLILDDLGSENISDFSQEILFTLLNARTLVENKPVVLSSNYSIEDLEDVYHPRIASRIKMLTTILDCVGDDIREML
ncbi:MAG: ATP-binding protein [Clostridia bacterium]